MSRLLLYGKGCVAGLWLALKIIGVGALIGFGLACGVVSFYGIFIL